MVRWVANLTWIFIVLFTWSAKANFHNETDYYFETISDQDSLPSCCTALIQGKNGYIWIGTQAGLVRYDGYYYKHFKHDTKNSHSITGNTIKTLDQAQDGRIWIGTAADGVSVFDPSTERFKNFKFQENKNNTISHNRVEAIRVDSNNQVWIGTNHGLDRLDIKSGEITQFRHDPDNPNSLSDNHIRSILIDDANQIWIGTWKGLNLLRQDTNDFSHPHSNPNDPDSLYHQNIFKMFQSENGKIWLGTVQHGIAWFTKGGKLNQISADPKNVHKLSAPWISSFAQPNNKEIWAGTFVGGINVIDTHTGKVIRHIRHNEANTSSLNLDSVGAMLIDKSGLIWVGDWGGQLSIYNPNNHSFRSLRHIPGNINSLSFPAVESILELKNGQIWIGTQGNGIDVLDPEKGIISGFRPNKHDPNALASGVISALVQTPDGTIWIGTQESGLYQYDTNTKSFKNYQLLGNKKISQIFTILPIDNNHLWVGRGAGIGLFDIKTKKFNYFFDQHNNIIDDPIRSIVKQADGTIWASSQSGLYTLRPNETLFEKVPHISAQSDSLSHEHVFGLIVDSKDRLWVITAVSLDLLINHDQNGWHFKSYNNEIDTSSMLLGDLLEDNQGKLWSSTAMLDPDTGDIADYSKAEGVDLGTFVQGAVTKTKQGDLLFGHTRGLLIITPDKFNPWQYQPEVKITKLTVDTKELPTIGNQILTLAPQVKNFSVEFSALDYSSPKHNQYAYKLIGYDDNWTKVDAKHRSVNYTNLDPGNYELVITGSNRKGKWSPHQATLTIIQLPAWYQTTWFRIVLMCGIFTCFYIIYQLRLRRLKQQKMILKKQVSDKTADILMLSEIGKELTSSLDLKQITAKVYQSINKVLDAHVFLLAVVEEQQNRLYLPFIIEKGKKLDASYIDLSNENRPAVWCVKNKKELIAANKTELLKYVKEQTLQPKSGYYMNSVIYQPLIIDDNVIGCLSIQNLNENAFTKEHIAMIRTLSSYTAVAMVNALGYRKLAQANHQLASTQKELEEKNKALKIALDNLEKISLTDQLTSAHNRRFLNNYINQELAKLKRQHYGSAQHQENDFGFMMIDADYFKYINDTYGHHAGDKVLVQMVDIITDTCRESDWVIRWGGEEFLVVARFLQQEQLHKLAERIRNNIANHHFDLGNGETITRTCSIGIVGFPLIKNNFDILNWEQTIDLADQALYAVKKNGRNAWLSIMAKESSHKHIPATADFLNLKTAIETNLLVYSSSNKNSKISF